MARTKKYFNYEIPKGIVEIVKAICADYVRRDRALRWDELNDGVRFEYLRLNGAIEGALGIIDTSSRLDMIGDIAQGRGYEFSPCSPFLAKNTYYQRKRQIVHDIAVNLGLL